MSADSTEWDLPTCRRHFRALQTAHREQSEDLNRTASELASATYALDLARKRAVVLQRELDAAHHRERALAELHACKRGGYSSNVTPLRPRAPRKP